MYSEIHMKRILLLKPNVHLTPSVMASCPYPSHILSRLWIFSLRQPSTAVTIHVGCMNDDYCACGIIALGYSNTFALILSWHLFRSTGKRSITRYVPSTLFAGATVASTHDYRELIRRKPTGVVLANWARSSCRERNASTAERFFLTFIAPIFVLHEPGYSRFSQSQTLG